MGSRATLRDVALAAGVSHKTASRVLNEDPHVADETRARVVAAMTRLRYEPDSMARSLRAGRDNSVGVLIDSLDDPFFASVAQAIETDLSRDGYLVMVATSHRDAEVEGRIVDQMLRRRVAALIVSPARSDAPWIARAGIPVVIVDRNVDADVAAVVTVDDRGGAARAVEHLVRHGHRRIAFLGDPPVIEPTLNRIAGYRDALADAGIVADRALLRDDTATPAEAAAAVAELLALPDPPTALFTASRRASLGAVPTLHSLDRTDIAIVGFGDFAMAEALTPGITVIDHPATAVGEAAARALRDAMTSVTGSAGAISVPLRLVERGSGEI